LPSSKNYTEEMAVSELKYQQGISDKRPIPQSDTVPKISSNQIVTIHGDFPVGVNDTIPRAERIIRKTEVEAGINKRTWQSFLSTHLHDFLFSLAQKAPPGRYTAYLRFVVKTDGAVEDVTVVKDPGYGIGDKLVNVLKESPKWYPGLYNGVPVNSYHTQPVTLVIAPQ
jgi:hypothetical protein